MLWVCLTSKPNYINTPFNRGFTSKAAQFRQSQRQVVVVGLMRHAYRSKSPRSGRCSSREGSVVYRKQPGLRGRRFKCVPWCGTGVRPAERVASSHVFFFLVFFLKKGEKMCWLCHQTTVTLCRVSWQICPFTPSGRHGTAPHLSTRRYNVCTY